MNRAPDILIYDGACRFCVQASKTLERLSGQGHLSRRSFRDEAVRKEYPDIPLDRFEKAMQLVRSDGKVFQGAEAAVQAMRHRSLGLLAKTYYLPGLKQLVDLTYRLIARYRFRIAARACEGGTCSTHL